MSDVRLVGTSPEDGSLIPVAVTPAGLLKTAIGTIELIPNNVTIEGDLTITGTINGEQIGGDGGGGSGLPEPYGPEGSVLTIVNGEPVWQAPAYRACQQWAEVTLVNNEPVDGEISAFRGDPPPAPGAIWDEYARSQPTWSTPDESAVAGLVKNSGPATMATFNITADHGRVLVFRVAHRCTCSVVSTGGKSICTADNENVVPIANEVSFTVAKGENYHFAEYTFLLNRPAVGNVKFTFKYPSGLPISFTADQGSFVQSWETEDTTTFLARRLKESDLSLEELKAGLQAAQGA